MTAPVFVDTNLLVYAHQANEPVKQPVARRWLEKLWEERAARTSIQVLNEYYVCLTRKIRPAVAPDDAWDIVSDLFAWNPLPIDTALLSLGRDLSRRYGLSWWDSLIVAAAQAQNCRVLLTEDLQDRGTYGGVTVRNPFTLGVSEPLMEYDVPKAAPRHRKRGRPARRAPERTGS